MPSKRHRRAQLSIFLLLALPSLATVQAQQDKPQAVLQDKSPASPADAKPDAADDPQVPGLSSPLRGWNAGVTFSGIHESSTGWATLASPALGYSFNDIFSVDATLPIYFYRLADSLSTSPLPNAQLVAQRAELGDLVFGLHAQFIPSLFQYQLTGAFTVPTGDEVYGLSTGRVTFDINNHIERTFGHLTPNIEVGGGDSTTLVNRIVTKNYTSLGPLAHFQVGLGIDLIHGASFESDAYEQLPLGDQKIYGPSRGSTATIVTGHNAIEDNGFINALDIPLNRHVTLSGYYSRSLRLRSDTAAIGITYVLRSSPPPEDTPAK